MNLAQKFRKISTESNYSEFLQEKYIKPLLTNIEKEANKGKFHYDLHIWGYSEELIETIRTVLKSEGFKVTQYDEDSEYIFIQW